MRTISESAANAEKIEGKKKKKTCENTKTYYILHMFNVHVSSVPCAHTKLSFFKERIVGLLLHAILLYRVFSFLLHMFAPPLPYVYTSTCPMLFVPLCSRISHFCDSLVTASLFGTIF